jgi:two-component system, cell cycle response regulator
MPPTPVPAANLTGSLASLAPIHAGVVAAWREQYAAPERALRRASELLAELDESEPISAAWAALLVALQHTRQFDAATAKDAHAIAAERFHDFKDARGARMADVVGQFIAMAAGDSVAALAGFERLHGTVNTAAMPWQPMDLHLLRHGLALVNARMGHVDRVLHYHYENVALAEQFKDPSPLAVTLLNLSSALLSLDAWSEAYESAVSSHTIAMTLDNPVLVRRAEINVAMSLRYLGRLSEAREVLDRLVQEDFYDPGSAFLLAISAAELCALVDDMAAAQTHLASASHIARQTQRPYELANCDWLAGLIYSRQQRWSSAIQSLEQAVGRARELRHMHVGILPRMMRLLAECYAAASDYPRAYDTFRVFHEVSDARHQYSTGVRMIGLRTQLQRDQGVRAKAREDALSARFAEEQLALAAANKALADRVSEVESLAGRLQYAADRDPLTGLYNRRQLDRTLNSLTNDARRQGGATVALLDIDHFKSVNDTFGHAVGDEVLVALAEQLQQSLRGEDIVARYGGEEFCVVMFGATPDDALRKMTEVLMTFKSFTLASAPGRAFSFSCGIAECPGECLNDDGVASPTLLLQRADARLYAAKHAGRSRIHVQDV